MKKAIAFIIDLFGSFLVFGYSIGLVTGGLTSTGFKLDGLPALLLFVFVILYFVLSKKLLGRTLGQMLLRIKK